MTRNTPGRHLPPHFNATVNAVLDDATMDPNQKAYIIGAMFLPWAEHWEVMKAHHPGKRDADHSPPPPPGKFGLWEVED